MSDYTDAERRGALRVLDKAISMAFPMMHLNEYHVKALPLADLLDLRNQIQKGDDS